MFGSVYNYFAGETKKGQVISDPFNCTHVAYTFPNAPKDPNAPVVVHLPSPPPAYSAEDALPPYAQPVEVPPPPPAAPGDVPAPPAPTVVTIVVKKNNQNIEFISKPLQELQKSFDQELREKIESRKKPNGDIAVVQSMKKPQENKDALTLQEQLAERVKSKKPNGDAVVERMKKPQESKGDPILSDELAAKFERMRLRNSSKS